MGKMDGFIQNLMRGARLCEEKQQAVQEQPDPAFFLRVEHKILRVFANLSFYDRDNANFICREEEHEFSAVKLCVKHMNLFTKHISDEKVKSRDEKSGGEFARLACATLANLCHCENHIRDLALKYGAIEWFVHVVNAFMARDEVIALDDDEFDLRDNALRGLDNLLESRTFLRLVVNQPVVLLPFVLFAFLAVSFLCLLSAIFLYWV